MLLAENLLSSILALLIGLPTAVVLSEIVSLVTAKLVGMGIIGHHFSLSWSAMKWTLVGFLAIKLTALLILSGRISHQEIGTLLSQPANRPKKQMPSVFYGLAAVFSRKKEVRERDCILRHYAHTKCFCQYCTNSK